MSHLTKDGFLKVPELKRERVDIEGFGLVTLRELAVAERLEFAKRRADAREAAGDDEGDVATAYELVVISLCNEDNSPMFTGDEEIAAGCAALGQRGSREVQALQRAFLRVNGLEETEIAEELGNSEGTPSGSSSSA